MKLNNKGFAISTILYGLLVLIVLTTSLILGTMAFMRKNSKNFVDDVKKNLENTDTKSPTIEIIDFKRIILKVLSSDTEKSPENTLSKWKERIKWIK